MASNININDTFHYDNLRAAINALLTSDTLNIGTGSYSITDTTGTGNYFDTTLARFQAVPPTSVDPASTITGFVMQGAGVDDTTITGLTRIYASAKDAGFGLPAEWTISNLTLAFNFTGTEYILQTGNRIFSDGEVVGASKGVTALTLQNLKFTGFHQGSGTASGGAYSDLAAADNLFVDNIVVDLTGQKTYTAGTTTSLSSGGSAFLFANGTGITIQNSTFNEGGFGNSVTLYDSSVTVSGNTFDAEGQRKQRGQVISNSTGSISTNQFLNGTHLDLLGSTNARKAISVTVNTFDAGTTTFGLGVVIGQPGQSLFNFRTTTLTGNEFKNVVPFVSLISTAATGTSGGTGLTGTQQLQFGSNKVWNPVLSSGSGAYQTFNRFYVGGTSGDLLQAGTSTSHKDFLDGGLGNDTLSGSGAPDAFAFTSALNATTNVDNITDFKASGATDSDKIWLDDSIFTSLSAGALNSADFGTAAAAGTDIVYTGGSLYFAADGASDISGYTKFANITNSASITASDFVVF
jgi:hypothetical protein